MKKEERKWFTVSGVEEEVWRMAKASAALNGEPLGLWLKKAILMYVKYCGGVSDPRLGRLEVVEENTNGINDPRISRTEVMVEPVKGIKDKRVGRVKGLEEHSKDSI